MRHGHVRCIDSDNRYNRAIERVHGFDRLFGVSQRTYRGSYGAIYAFELRVRARGYATTAWPISGGIGNEWTLTVFRTGRKD